MDILACRRCASCSMHAANIGNGDVLGYSMIGQVVCDQCSFQGPPLVFSRPEDYEGFRVAVERGENPLDLEDAGPPELEPEWPDAAKQVQISGLAFLGTRNPVAVVAVMTVAAVAIFWTVMLLGTLAPIIGLLVLPLVAIALGLQLWLPWRMWHDSA